MRWVPLKVLDELCTPQRKTAEAAGYDLVARHNAWCWPFRPTRVQVGVALALPKGFHADVRGRSGHSLGGLWCTPGLIDSDYRGEIGAVLLNVGLWPKCVRRGDRVAQLVICPHEAVAWTHTTRLEETGRGAGGFGSTGLRVLEDGRGPA